MNKKQEILDAYYYRFACKDFDPNKKISDDDFAFILETGRLSPSSFGFEPWKFVVVQNMDVRKKLMEYAPGAKRQLPTASHFVLLLSRKAKDLMPNSDYINYISRDIQKLPEPIVEMRNDFYKNFIEKDSESDNAKNIFNWAAKQVYIPLGNMMTSAAQIGIDSCPMEGFDQDKIDDILEEEGIINKEQFSTVAMVAFGYRAADTRIPEKARQPIEKVVQWVK